MRASAARFEKCLDSVLGVRLYVYLAVAAMIVAGVVGYGHWRYNAGEAKVQAQMDALKVDYAAKYQAAQDAARGAQKAADAKALAQSEELAERGQQAAQEAQDAIDRTSKALTAAKARIERLTHENQNVADWRRAVIPAHADLVRP